MIRLNNVSYAYSGSQEPVLSDINLEIADTEFIAIMGKNGSGKSTLARLLNGLLLPSNGRVEVDGFCTGSPDERKEIRRKVGMLFSSPDNQLIAGCVEEDLAFGPGNMGLDAVTIKNRVDTALKLVSMEDYKKYPPNFLSGGQKQKAAIAGLLAMRPEHMVLDEPTAMLDSLDRRDIMDVLLGLNKKEKISLILVSHRLEEAVLADRIVILDRGTVVMEGSAKDIVSHSDVLQKTGIKPLEISTIIKRLNQSEMINIEPDIYKIDDLVDEICRCKSQI